MTVDDIMWTVGPLPEDWSITTLVDTADDWQTQGLCAQTDPEAFFPEQGEPNRAAVRVCEQCPVQVRCLEWALANNEPYGVWGGVTENERRGLRAKRREVCRRDSCSNLRSMSGEGLVRMYCSDQCFALARIESRPVPFAVAPVRPPPKRCPRCGVEKPRNEFYRQPGVRGSDPRSPRCMECTKELLRERRAKQRVAS